MLYNKLKIGDYVYDPDMNTYGMVKEISDIHNIFVEYEGGDGCGGLYCLDPSCDEFDESLKIITNET